MFLKLADKGGMGKVLEEFENWPDQIINLRVTFLWLLKKPLFGFVISIAPSVLIRCSWNLQIRCTWMKSWTSLKTGQIRSLVLEFIPFIAEQASVWLCHQHNSIGFDQMFLKLPEQVDMDEILEEFENWPDQIMDLRVMSLIAVKASWPLFDFVISVTCSVLLESSWNLQIRWTWMKSRTS